MQAGIVLVPCDNELCRVAGEKEVLKIDVAEKDLLMAAFERVESAVSVFFKKMEVGEIVFDAIAVKVAEDSQGRLFVNKKKAAKVSVELLDTRACRNKVVIGTEIVKLHFDESFLEAGVIVKAVGAAARIGANDAQFADFQIVQAELWS